MPDTSNSRKIPAKDSSAGLAPRRLRGPRIYLADGRRVLDLCLDGGRALLGHKSEGVLLAFKNSAERGLLSPWPGHPLCRQFMRELSSFFSPLFTDPLPLVYESREALDAALAALSCPPSGALFDPAAPALTASAVAAANAAPGPLRAALWRPWLGPAARGELPLPAAILVPVLPFPLPGSPLVLVAERSELSALSSSSLPAPAVLASALKALSLLARAPDRDIPHIYPSLKPLYEGTGAAWHLNGSWLSLRQRIADADWQAFRFLALEAGVYLPTSTRAPLFLSTGFSQGECALLLRILSQAPGSPLA